MILTARRLLIPIGALALSFVVLEDGVAEAEKNAAPSREIERSVSAAKPSPDEEAASPTPRRMVDPAGSIKKPTAIDAKPSNQPRDAQASQIPRVSTATPRSVRLTPGAKAEVRVRIGGSSLDRVDGVEIVRGRNSPAEVEVRVEARGKTEADIFLRSSASAKAAGDYRIQLRSGPRRIPVPLRVEVVAAKASAKTERTTATAIADKKAIADKTAIATRTAPSEKPPRATATLVPDKEAARSAAAIQDKTAAATRTKIPDKTGVAITERSPVRDGAFTRVADRQVDAQAPGTTLLRVIVSNGAGAALCVGSPSNFSEYGAVRVGANGTASVEIPRQTVIRVVVDKEGFVRFQKDEIFNDLQAETVLRRFSLASGAGGGQIEIENGRCKQVTYEAVQPDIPSIVPAPEEESGGLNPVGRAERPLALTYFALNGGNDATSDRLVTLDHRFLREFGLNNLQFRASQSASFEGAEWRDHGGAPEPPPTIQVTTWAGSKTVYFQLRAEDAEGNEVLSQVRNDAVLLIHSGEPRPLERETVGPIGGHEVIPLARAGGWEFQVQHLANWGCNVTDDGLIYVQMVPGPFPLCNKCRFTMFAGPNLAREWEIERVEFPTLSDGAAPKMLFETRWSGDSPTFVMTGEVCLLSRLGPGGLTPPMEIWLRGPIDSEWQDAFGGNP
jgi:hypothetical protein